MQKKSIFVRFLTVIFCVILCVMVGYKFFYIEPKAEISGGLLVLLAFILVLVLSELFDSFSIGKLITMSKNLNEKDRQSKELKKENNELRNQIITVATTMSQNQTSNTIFGGQFLPDFLKVKRAEESEIVEKQKEEELLKIQQPEAVVARRTDLNKVEEYALNGFVAKNNLQGFNFIRDAKLSAQLSGTDLITDTTPIFDGYVNAPSAEIFIEVKRAHFISIAFRDRLYVMLAKINHYKAIKKSNAYLVLVVVYIPEETKYPLEFYLNRITREFEPAIASGLLLIQVIEPTSEDMLGLYAD